MNTNTARALADTRIEELQAIKNELTTKRDTAETEEDYNEASFELTEIRTHINVVNMLADSCNVFIATEQDAFDNEQVLDDMEEFMQDMGYKIIINFDKVLTVGLNEITRAKKVTRMSTKYIADMVDNHNFKRDGMLTVYHPTQVGSFEVRVTLREERLHIEVEHEGVTEAHGTIGYFQRLDLINSRIASVINEGVEALS